MSKSLVSPIDQYVIDTVRKLRVEKGYSQKELGNMLDLSIGFMGDIESTKTDAKYNLKHINELAKIFKCSPKDFLPDAPL
jgi:transcriptional regulator with XRE-family HTH domain